MKPAVIRTARGVPAGLALLLAGCGGGRGTTAHAVEIRGFVFAPDTVVAAVGDTVVWTNHDVVPHTATRSGGPDTGQIDANGSGRWVVEAAGTHDYVCAYHPTMRGTVVVR